MICKYTGTVIKAIDYADSHKILTVLTREKGKLNCIAKRVRKINNNLKLAIEPFTEACFYLFHGRGMPALNQADIIQIHTCLHYDPLLSVQGAYWLELADKLLPELDPNTRFYDWFMDAFRQLAGQKPATFLQLIVELQFLQIAGYKPSLENCVACGQKENLVAFTVKQGGVVCANCRDLDAEYLSEETIQLFALCQNSGLAYQGAVPSEVDLAQIMRIVHEFYLYHVPIKLKSKEVIRKMHKNLAAVQSGSSR